MARQGGATTAPSFRVRDVTAAPLCSQGRTRLKMALEKKRWLEFWALLAVGTCDSSIVRLEIENVRELEGVMHVLPSNHATVERGFASRTGKSLSLEIGAWSHLQILKLKSIGLRGTWARAQAEHTESIRTHMRPECSPRVPVYRCHTGVDRRAEQPADPRSLRQRPLGYVCAILC